MAWLVSDASHFAGQSYSGFAICQTGEIIFTYSSSLRSRILIIRVIQNAIGRTASTQSG